MIKGNKILLCIALLVMGSSALCQIGIMTSNPDASAELDIYSLDKGILIPRISLSTDLFSPSPVESPVDGLLVFNTGNNQPLGLYYWSVNQWLLLQTPTDDTLSGHGISTDEAVVRFDGNSGKKVQNAIITLDDANTIANINQLTAEGFSMTINPGQGKVLSSDKAGNGTWQYNTPFGVKKEGATVLNNATVLNFVGGNTVNDDGDGQASVAFYANSVTRNLIQLSSSDSLSLNDLFVSTPVPWDVEYQKNAATFIHSTTVNPSRIQVRSTGYYEVNYIINTVSKTIQRKTLRVRLRKNGSEIFPFTACYSFSYNMADFESAHNSSSFLIFLKEDDYIEVIGNGQTNSGPLELLPLQNVFFVRLMREM